MTSTFLMPIRPDAWIEQSILFAVITLRLTGPVSLLNQTQALINNFSPALRSLLDFIDRTDKPYLKNGSVPFEVIQTGITLQNVHFHYTTAGLPALENVTFHIPKNRITAIVGPSGAGKSTLVNLLTRLYDCNAGRILIDENDLHDLEVRSWRSQIAVVSQDNFLFNDTVTANIRFARNKATDQEIVAAAKLAQAHDFIISLPQGYDTVLGDRGVRLSGGQQQRLAIARAMLVDPQFVIFDEATSDLDSLTEQAIQEAIEHYSRGRTTLVIAHRLTTIRRADNIVVLDQGRVVEQGTHAQLMQLAGYYRQLVQTQYLGEAGFVDAVYSRS
jgi:ABC-type multidrug transport system fused ATPase/permease subunit